MNLFEHTHAHWARYTDYQWRKAADGQAYLLPVSEAEATIYDPIPLASRLVTDAVNIGLLVFHKQPDSEIQEAIRSFACGSLRKVIASAACILSSPETFHSDSVSCL